MKIRFPGWWISQDDPFEGEIPEDIGAAQLIDHAILESMDTDYRVNMSGEDLIGILKQAGYEIVKA